MFRRGGVALSMVLLLNLPASSCAVKSSLRVNVNNGKSAEQLVTDAMNTGVMLMSKLMAKEQDEVDGPQPSKASMDLEEKANNLFYSAYNRLNLARTSAEAALELIQMDDKSRWDSANQNLQDAQRLLKDGSDQMREGQDNLNRAYAGSPDVDPNAKVWSETGGMARRARNLKQQVESALSRLKRKSPKAFQLLQLKTSTGFKEASEKKVEVKDAVEDSLVNFVESYKFM